MTETLDVVHLLKGLGPGGAERLVVAQTTADPIHRHRVAYLIPEKSHLVPLLTNADVETVCLDSSSAAGLGWLRRLRTLLRTSECDVLHVHSPALAAATRVMLRTLPRTTRPALVSTEHNRWPRHHRLTRAANRLTIRFQDATIAVSDDVRSTVRGIAADEVRVIEHGIDLDEVRNAADRDAVRDELDIAADDIVALCVANLRREKSLDDLVTAARIALASMPSLRYFLIGQGPMAADLTQWIAAAGIGERFTALGYREDAPRVMSGADIFTMSSTHEGLPVAIMEALAQGLPVAATAAGGIPAAVGRAGLITPVGDPDALARSHTTLATDVDARRRLGEAAAAEASRFSIQRAIGEIDRVYVEAIAIAESDRSSQS